MWSSEVAYSPHQKKIKIRINLFFHVFLGHENLGQIFQKVNLIYEGTDMTKFRYVFI